MSCLIKLGRSVAGMATGIRWLQDAHPVGCESGAPHRRHGGARQPSRVIRRSHQSRPALGTFRPSSGFCSYQR
jgi:hypothetical protein